MTLQYHIIGKYYWHCEMAFTFSSVPVAAPPRPGVWPVYWRCCMIWRRWDWWTISHPAATQLTSPSKLCLFRGPFSTNSACSEDLSQQTACLEVLSQSTLLVPMTVWRLVKITEKRIWFLTLYAVFAHFIILWYVGLCF